MRWMIAMLWCTTAAAAPAHPPLVQDEPAPAVVEEPRPLRGIVQLALGSAHTCGRRADGTVLCWGLGDEGQRGDGRAGEIGWPVVVRRFPHLTAIAAGDLYTCAQTDGAIWCWGNNSTYELGVGDAARPDASVSGGTRTKPVRSRRFGAPAAIALGDVSYAISAAGRVTCVGHSNFCGWDAGTSVVPDLPPIASVAVGDGHACAVSRAGEVYCWGRTDWGQGGSGLDHTDQAPTRVDGLADVVEVAAGAAHTCARTAAGDVYCWGDNEKGELGDGTTTQRDRPVKTAIAHAVGLALGGFGSCARLDDGTVSCWGALGGVTPAPVPLAHVVELAVGGAHACARLDDDTVRCWGENHDGQLGDGTFTDRAAPVVVIAPDR
jgi:alpha-tubulin suppressor-like RCC1 family protein